MEHQVPPSEAGQRARPASRNVRLLISLAGAGALATGILLAVIAQLLVAPPIPAPIGGRPSSSPASPMGSQAYASVVPSPSTPPSGSSPPAASTAPGAKPSAISAGARLPVKGSGRDIGTEIRMAPGPEGGLYVSIPADDGQTVALLGRNGKPRPGWPIHLTGVADCGKLLSATDARFPMLGSVWVVCTVPHPDAELGPTLRRAFAFAPDGGPFPGWPVDIEGGFEERVLGATLVMIVQLHEGDVVEPGAPTRAHITSVDVAGTVVAGEDVAIPCGECRWALSPEAIAFVTIHRDWSPDDLAVVKTDVFAFDQNGMRSGRPVTIDGNASEVNFDARGLAYLTVGSPEAPPAQLVVMNRDGRVTSTSESRYLAASSTWDGAGGETPGPPSVGEDGTAYIISTAEGTTTVFGFEHGGDNFLVYRSSRGMQWTGYCSDADVGCGHYRTVPVAGGGKILYVVQAAAKPSVGGRIIAVGHDGAIRPGWPLELRRGGAMFWSVVANPAGGIWALAIEPERHGSSATVLGIASDSTVRFATTLVEP